MIPFRLLPLVSLSALGLLPTFADTPEAEAIRGEWKSQRDSALSGKGLDAAKVAASAEAMRSLLFKENPNPLKPLAAELIGYTTAQAWVKQGNFEKAGDAFSAELLAQESAANPLLHNTPNPAGFAQDVFVLHSEIAAHTEQEIANSDYLIFPVGGGNDRPFVFVYGTEDPSERGVRLAGVDPGLQRRVVYLTAPGAQGHYRIADHVEVLGDRSSFTAQVKFDDQKPFLVLDGVRRLVQYNAAGIPQVYDCPSSKLRLKIESAKLEQPAAALARNGQKPGALCVLPPPPPPVAGLDAPVLASGPVDVAASIVTTVLKNPAAFAPALTPATSPSNNKPPATLPSVTASKAGPTLASSAPSATPGNAKTLSISAPTPAAPVMKPGIAASGVTLDSKPSESSSADQPSHVAAGLDIGSPTIKKANSDHEDHGPG